ncbi:DNA-binding protein [Pseudomonas sp. LPB0260]|nr:DNA-binding protein [Pseudomonas sp. LPB0260]QLC77520.1 DNA-binding protein [Pseudomonas sp. LPB0260]QLC77650.1 DNA-binding protein [Pseudomonas sp. LPB0260]
MASTADRARTLIKLVGPKRASEEGGAYERWRNVSKGAVRVGAEEIDVLVKIYPQYALWLASGQIAPEIGQTSPAYDEANRNLSQPNAG